MAGLTEPISWALALSVLGAVFGSFIATVAVRWPASALVGRSRCDGCRRTLTGWELVPLLGWAIVRGRCRSCAARIDWRHPAIEAIGVAIGATAGAVAPGAVGVAGAVFGWLLLVLGAIDAVAYRLPHNLTWLLGWTGFVAGLAAIPPTTSDRAIGGVVGYGVLWTVAWLYERVRGRAGLGGGDPRMLAAIGLWVGWRGLAPTVLIAAITGLMWAAAARKRMGDRLPFGTLLAIGGFAVWVAYHAGP